MRDIQRLSTPSKSRDLQIVFRVASPKAKIRCFIQRVHLNPLKDLCFRIKKVISPYTVHIITLLELKTEFNIKTQT